MSTIGEQNNMLSRNIRDKKELIDSGDQMSDLLYLSVEINLVEKFYIIFKFIEIFNKIYYAADNVE